MSELAGLRPKRKEFDINGMKLSFLPLDMDEEVAQFIEDADKGKPSEQILKSKKLIERMLKESYPEATEEELKDCMKLNNLIPLMNAFVEVMGLSEAKANPKVNLIKERINALREQAGQPKI